MESGGIRYDLVRPDNFGPAARLIADVFSRHEPLAVASGQTMDELVEMLSLTTPGALEPELSVLASRDGIVIGTALATAFTWLPSEAAVAASPNYAPIGALLEELEADFGSRPKDELECCLHVHMLAVDDGHRNRGTGRELLRLCLENASVRGMTAAVSDATNAASRRTFEAVGFASIGEVHYAGFEFEGTRPFAKIPNADHTALMYRKL